MTRRRLLLMLLAVLVAAGGWYGWRQLSAPEPPAVALDGSDPELEVAIEAARGKVRQSPYSASAWGGLGMLLRGARLLEPAEKCFAQAERLERDEPRWAYLRGEALLSREPDAALPHLRRAAELWDRGEPPHIAPWLRLAEVLLERGELEEAERYLRRALDTDPGNPSLHLQLGLLFSSRDELAAAKKHLLKAQHSPYTRKQACAQLAAVCRRLREKQSAEDFAAQAAALPRDNDWIDPFVAECLLLVAGKAEKLRRIEQLESRGNWWQAVELLSEVAAKSPDARVFVGLGRNLLRLGDLEGAEKALQSALKHEGEQVQSKYLLGQLALMRAKKAEQKSDKPRMVQQYQEAVRLADEVIALKPDHALAHVLRGLALRGLGQRAEGLLALRQALGRGPELADTHLHLGEALAEEGQSREARHELELAVRLAAPEDSRPRRALEKLPRP